MRNTTIYLLRDPNDLTVRYIGKTVKAPVRRLQHHVAAAKRRVKTHCSNWIWSLLQSGMTPLIEVIEVCSGEWISREQYWIEYYRSNGADLTNHTNGGEGLAGLSRSAETRRKMSESQRGRIITAEQRQRISGTLKRYFSDPAARERISIGMRGHKHCVGVKQSPAAIENMRAAALRRSADPEVRANFSAGQRKRYQDPAERRKSAEKSKAIWTPEFRAAQVALYQDPEFRAAHAEKIRKSWIIRRQKKESF